MSDDSTPHVVIAWRHTPDGEPATLWQYGKAVPAWVQGDALTAQRRYVVAHARATVSFGTVGRIVTKVVSEEQWEAMRDEPEHAYHAVAAELPELRLDELDPAVVRTARLYAYDRDLPWPPVPETDGWTVTVQSTR